MTYNKNICLIFLFIITACTAPASANNIYYQKLQVKAAQDYIYAHAS